MARKNGKDRGIVEKPAGSGQWWVRLYENGRERWTRCDSKSQASALYHRLKEQVRQGVLLPKPAAVPVVRLKEYVPRYLEQLPLRGVKALTVATYRARITKHLVPAFGGSPLHAITRPAVKEWAAALLQHGLDFNTVKGLALTLSGILTQAVEDQVLSHNPLLRLGTMLKRPSTIADEELPCFTPAEEDVILTAAKAKPGPAYPMILTLFRTGVRIGELLALHREDVNTVSRTLHVRRTWSKWRLSTPKSGKSRKVDLSPHLLDVLRAWMDVSQLDAAMGEHPCPPMLFPGGLGGTRQAPFYYSENAFRSTIWFPVLEQAQVSRLPVHAARHTYASRLLAAGVPIKYVQAQLGHASITVTVDTYGHWLPATGSHRPVDVLDREEMAAATGSKTGSDRRENV
ncbi:hypothetical protein DNFV4_02817 [Nitrospira tepida]|uniref:Tyr recombinase domain-containing protein n=1 Tax=Nitrospira tepida TaxID=2973512 RepID=A0AA86T672_9BACT|nr:tyrosine-type recombinase/integrase [Nitrospira tepida]CAI4032387.1 hypothetical protein DNFV4_02817 [Nitrospira tepida]